MQEVQIHETSYAVFEDNNLSFGIEIHEKSKKLHIDIDESSNQG